MNIRLSILTTLAVSMAMALGTVSVRAQKLSFGYVSYSTLLHAMPEYAEAQQSLKQMRDTYDQESKHSEDHFYNLYSEYIVGQKSFPEEIMLKRQKELQTAMELNINFKKDAEKLLRNAERELVGAVEAKLDKAIAQTAQHFQLSLVANTDDHAYPYVNPHDGIDLNNYVTMVLNNLPLPVIRDVDPLAEPAPTAPTVTAPATDATAGTAPAHDAPADSAQPDTPATDLQK